MRWLVTLVFVMGACSAADDVDGLLAHDTTGAADTQTSHDAPVSQDSTGPPDVAPPEELEPLDFASVDTELEAFVNQTAAVEGVGVIVIHGVRGIVYETAVGAFAPDRVYYVASSSKIVTAGMMVKLADDGLVDLDGPLGEHVDWAAHNSGILPWQLVGNSSGLPGLLSAPNGGPQPAYICQFLPNGSVQDCAKTIAQADMGDATVPPETEFRYGGGQWQVAGGLMEDVTGSTWKDLIQATYIAPCGLDLFGYAMPFEGGLGYPSHLQGDPKNVKPATNPSMEGGVFTSVHDYGKMLSIHLNGGVCNWGDDAVRVLSEEAVSTMQIDRLASYGESTNIPSLPGYGMGWWVERENPGVFVDPGAWGAVAWIDLNKDYGVFIALEADPQTGAALRGRIQPLIETVLQAAE